MELKTLKVVANRKNIEAGEKYIVNWVLRERLGLDDCVSLKIEEDKYKFSVGSSDAQFILPRVFFRLAAQSDSKKVPLPSVSGYAPQIVVDGVHIPIIYGSNQKDHDPLIARVDFPIDVFGSAFFMLSRYEEFISNNRDLHGRFPASASVAAKMQFLNRPIIDEYIELLWNKLRSIWPALDRKRRVGRVVVTCDVDHPFVIARSLATTVKRFARGVWKRSRIVERYNYLRSVGGVLRSKIDSDPNYQDVKWIMDVNERQGNSVKFNFIPKWTHALDQSISIESPQIAKMWKNILERGHEIGIHPGYETCNNEQNMRETFRRFRDVLSRFEHGPVIEGRQHYLRWDVSQTPQLLDENGLTFDYTLGYADAAGFRCGTCHEFPLFDLVGGRGLTLRERPLICMDTTLFATTYMATRGAPVELNELLDLKKKCHDVGGDFVLLWHNAAPRNEFDRHYYQELIA